MSTNRYDISVGKSNFVSEARLLYISTAKYGGDWHSSLHSHPCTELFYVVGGTGGFQIENDRIQVKAHDLMIVNPNIRHTETSWNSSPLEYIVLGIEGFELTNPEKNDDRYFILNFKNLSDAVLTCMRMMLREVENKRPAYDSVCQNLLQVLVVQLIREMNVSPEVTVQATRRECSAAKWYMDAHFKEKITLDLLAGVTGVNKFYLVHSFTEEYGVSPIKYLTGKRIEESKYLLSTTDLPLGRIAQMLSFSSPSYYVRLFRGATGMTPSEYRNQSRIK